MKRAGSPRWLEFEGWDADEGDPAVSAGPEDEADELLSILE